VDIFGVLPEFGELKDGAEILGGYDPWLAVGEYLDLEMAVSKLPDDLREVVLLVAEGYTQEEIGETLGLSQSTVSRRWGEAVSILRGWCE